MTPSDVRLLARFCFLKGKHDLLRATCNVLVLVHFKTTPRRSTPDTLNDIIQEQVRAGVRALEFRCHTLKEQYTTLGKEFLHDESPETETPTDQAKAQNGAAHP